MKRAQLVALAREAARIIRAVALAVERRGDTLDDDLRRGAEVFRRMYDEPWRERARRRVDLRRVSLEVIHVGRALLMMMAPADLRTGVLAS